MKIFEININWWSHPYWVRPLIGQTIHKNLICTLMRKRSISCCFLINRQKPQTAEDTAVMYFLMFNSTLQTKYKKIISKPSSRSKESISFRVSHVLRASHRVFEKLKRFSLEVFSLSEKILQ